MIFKKTFFLIIILGVIFFATNVYAECGLSASWSAQKVSGPIDSQTIDLQNNKYFKLENTRIENNILYFDVKKEHSLGEDNINNLIRYKPNLPQFYGIQDAQNYKIFNVVFTKYGNTCDNYDQVVINLYNDWIFDFPQTE